MAFLTAHSLGQWPFFFSGRDPGHMPGNAIVLSAEDGAEDTLVPRLISLGADCSRISFVDAKKDWKGALHRVVLTDASVIVQAIRARDAQIAVFDPFQSFLPPKTKMNEMETVRPVVDGLAAIAKETQCCVILLGHLNKSKQESASYKFLGSVDWYNSARSVMLARMDPDNKPDGRLFFQLKNSLGAQATGGWTFSISDTSAPPFLWGKSTDATVESSFDTEKGPSGTKREEAEEFLRGELAGGERPVEELKSAATRIGVSWRTVWEAKRTLRVKARKDGFQGPWLWSLPKDAKNADL